MRPRPILVVALVLALAGVLLLGLFLTGHGPGCSCGGSGPCSCPAQTGPPSDFVAFGLMAVAGVLAVLGLARPAPRRSEPAPLPPTS